MEDIILKKPSMEYKEDILSYRQEFLDNNESMDGTGFLRNSKSADEFVLNSLKNEKELINKNFVNATQFLSIRKEDNKIVGMIQIRHCLNDNLLLCGGHIGYSVRKSERKKGYAKESLRQSLIYCRDVLHINKVLITCHKHNDASRNTILSQGGIKENEVLDKEYNSIVERYWINLK